VGTRTNALIEAALIFSLIMFYIWWLRYNYPGSWMPILGLMIVSHAWRHEAASNLGFCSHNIRRCVEDFLPVLLLVTLASLATGMLLQTTRPISFEDALLAWTAYIPWGLFQQYILNGYFVNRFASAGSPRAAALLSAAVFSGAHLPNWFLMLVTFGGGYCAAKVYRKYQNLYFLGLAHATIGFLLYLVVPDWISHHLVVGPGWFRH
jgi:membrane protease YdiL (CAAX protease family)